MKFEKLAILFQEIENISSRLEMMAKLSDFLSQISPEEAAISSYLLLGRVCPQFIPAEFNYSEKGVEKVLTNYAQIMGYKYEVEVKRQSLGDIGLVAEDVVNSNPAYKNVDGRSIEEVYQLLWKIVNASGKNSMDEKGAIFFELIKNATPVEAKFLARIIAGKMRLGASVNTILESLSFMLSGDKSLVEGLKSNYGTLADIGVISHSSVTAKKAVGPAVVKEIQSITVGIPVKSRLVERVENFEEVFERIGDRFYAQPKFDGLRCQAHVGVDYEKIKKSIDGAVWTKFYISSHEAAQSVASLDMFSNAPAVGQDGAGDVALFSRNLETLTDMFPEIVTALHSLKCESCVLDGEIEGVSENGESFLNFQETITRKRKYGVTEAVSDVPVRYFVFDILELNGRDLTKLDTKDRIVILNELLAQRHSELIQKTETREITNIDQLNQFFEECVKDGLEGLVVKQPTGEYRPGIRNYEWLKLKKSMDKKLVDSVDVVIMGYYYGSGKQSQLGIGALLAGVYNEETELFESITKIGTGFTEELWGRIFARLQPLKVDHKPVNYGLAESMHPDVWVTPEVVCTVEADEVTKSKLHEAGRTQLGYGLALRFPRMIEFDRDKSIDDLTTIGELIKK